MSNILTDEQLNKDAKELFNNFIEEIRNSSPSITEQEKEVLILKLKELQTVYEKTNESNVLEILDLKQKQALKILGLGSENKTFNKINDLVDLLKNNPNATSGIIIVEYLKSEKGFDLFEDKIDEKDIKELEKFFGGLFGFNLGKFLANHIKAEQIGSVLTYALSGKIEQDYALFLKENPKSTEKEISEYIKECIQKSDVEFKINLERDSNKNNGMVLFNNRSLDRCRGKQRYDNFVLDHNNNIFCTNVTTSNDLKSQNRSFINYFIAVNNFVKTRYVNGKDNPCFGKSVNFNYLCLGDFSYEKLTASKSGPITRGRGKDAINYINNTDLNLEHKKDLSQMPYLSLVQNCANLDELTIMLAHNPIIIGVDTIDLFLHSEKINELLKNNNIEEAKKLSLEIVCKKFTNISNALSEVLDNHNQTDGNSIFTNVNIGNYLEILMNSLENLSNFELNENIYLYSNLIENLNKLKVSFYKKSIVDTEFSKDYQNFCNKLFLLECKIKENANFAGGKHVDLTKIFDNQEIPSEKLNFKSDVDNFIKKLPSQNPDVVNGIKNKVTKISYEEKKELIAKFKSYLSLITSSIQDPINSELLKISNIDDKNKKVLGTTIIKSFYEMISSIEPVDYKKDVILNIKYSNRNADSDYMAATDLVRKLKKSGYGSASEILKQSKFLYKCIYKNSIDNSSYISINTNLRIKKLQEFVNFIESKLNIDVDNINNYKNKM